MMETLSNALSMLMGEISPSAAAAPAGGPGIVDSAVPQSPLILFLLAVGTCVSAVCLFFVIARMVAGQDRRRGIGLQDTPARHNRINPVVALLPYITMALIAAGAAWILQRSLAMGRLQSHTAAGLIGEAVLLMASLGVARLGFPLGLRRGMGLSMRHWFYDTLRGIIGYLAILPVCVAVLVACTAAFQRMGLPLPEHEMVKAAKTLPAAWLVVVFAVTTVLAPLAEEVFFRGVVQSMLRRYLRSPWAAILASSVIFALVHAPLWQTVLPLFVFAIALGYNYERTGRLWASILMHALFNLVFLIGALTQS